MCGLFKRLFRRKPPFWPGKGLLYQLEMEGTYVEEKYFDELYDALFRTGTISLLHYLKLKYNKHHKK